MAALTLCGVTAARDGGASQLIGLDLHVDDGDTVCLLGGSGTGKSTLLRVVAGLTTPTSGRVLLDGVDVTSRPARDRRVGLVMRTNTLPSAQTARRSIQLPLVMRRRRGNHRQAVDVEADRLGIEALLDRPNPTLSGGQRVLVQSARALIDSPTVLLLDEPFADLDPHRRVLLRQRLASRWADITVLLATSDPTEAMAVSDRVVVLADGAVRQAGTVAELRDEPADTLVAELLGEPSMLLVPAQVRHRAGETVLRIGDVSVPAWKPELRTLDGLRLAVGVWPEDASSPPRPGDVVLRGVVTNVEPLGPSTLTHVDLEAGGRVRLPVPGAARRLGEAIEVGIDGSRLHVFEPIDGRAITHPPPRGHTSLRH
ncbi:MAG: ABC transporter ATP-binding protein [Actinomycetota bacterium]